MKHCVRTLTLLFSLILAMGSGATPVLDSATQTAVQHAHHHGVHSQHIDMATVTGDLCSGNCQQHCPQQASGCDRCDGCVQGCDPGIVSTPPASVTRPQNSLDLSSGLKRQLSSLRERPPKVHYLA